MAPNVEASGIISKKNLDFKAKNVKSYDKQTFINKLPGYTAQNSTFELMIGFLFVISLIIIAVFLYILTMQKMPNYAVLRAQGIPSKDFNWRNVKSIAYFGDFRYGFSIYSDAYYS